MGMAFGGKNQATSRPRWFELEAREGTPCLIIRTLGLLGSEETEKEKTGDVLAGTMGFPFEGLPGGAKSLSVGTITIVIDQGRAGEKLFFSQTNGRGPNQLGPKTLLAKAGGAVGNSPRASNGWTKNRATTIVAVSFPD